MKIGVKPYKSKINLRMKYLSNKKGFLGIDNKLKTIPFGLEKTVDKKWTQRNY